MQVEFIKPSVELIQPERFDRTQILKLIESAGRTCYKSEDKITQESASRFVSGLVKKGHHSVLEHVCLSFRIICDRGVSHELVRHRIASYSQESTRYVNYSNKMQFIVPCFWDEDSSNTNALHYFCVECAELYEEMIENGASPQQARAILPNCLKTEIVCTFNLRSLMNFFSLRCNKAAHPQMREVAGMMLDIVKPMLPEIYGEFTCD